MNASATPVAAAARNPSPTPIAPPPDASKTGHYGRIILIVISVLLALGLVLKVFLIFTHALGPVVATTQVVAEQSAPPAAPAYDASQTPPAVASAPAHATLGVLAQMTQRQFGSTETWLQVVVFVGGIVTLALLLGAAVYILSSLLTSLASGKGLIIGAFGLLAVFIACVIIFQPLAFGRWRDQMAVAMHSTSAQTTSSAQAGMEQVESASLPAQSCNPSNYCPLAFDPVSNATVSQEIPSGYTLCLTDDAHRDIIKTADIKVDVTANGRDLGFLEDNPGIQTADHFIVGRQNPSLTRILFAFTPVGQSC